MAVTPDLAEAGGLGFRPEDRWQGRRALMSVMNCIWVTLRCDGILDEEYNRRCARGLGFNPDDGWQGSRS